MKLLDEIWRILFFLMMSFGLHPWNPKNGGLEDDFPFQQGDSQVLC